MAFSLFPWRNDEEIFNKVEELFAHKEFENNTIFNFGIELHEEQLKDSTDAHIGLVFNGGRYPDAILYDESTGETVRIEFESCSSHFKSHRYNPHECDLIVCSFDDWEEVYPNEKCPLPIYVVGSKRLTSINSPLLQI